MPPRVGLPLAPPPSDLEEVLATAAPLDSSVPFDPAMESEWTAKDGARRTRTSRTSTPKVTVYDYQGDDRQVTIEDLVSITDESLQPDRRMYLRCPKCVTRPNGGLHEFSGPNACPAKAQQKFMTCPVCASYGRDKRVYEVEPLKATVDAANNDDPNYVEADLPDPTGGREQLQDKLYQHMTAFHSAETEQMYGVRREVNGNSFRIVRTRN